MSANIYNADGTRKTPADADKIRLGQKIEAWEARMGEPSPQRLLAERAIEAIRSSNSLVELRQQTACTIVIEEKIDAKGRLRYSGFAKADDGSGLKVNLYALPKDCAAYAIMKRFEEKTAKQPKAPSKQPKAPSIKALTANQAKFHGRQILNAAQTFAEAETLLAQKGMTIERQGKTGAYLRFAEGDEGRIKLSALGGKYSLNALSKKYADSDHILSSKHASSIASDHASVKKDAMEYASNRVSSATERAAGVAAEGATATTLLEALDDADAQARANDAVRRAKAVAAEAEKRAREAEERAAAAEQRLNTQNEDTKMNDLKPETGKAKIQQPEPASKATAHTTNNDPAQSKQEVPDTNTPEKETPLKTENSQEVNGENTETAKPKRKFGFLPPKSKAGGKFGFGGKPGHGQRM